MYHTESHAKRIFQGFYIMEFVQPIRDKAKIAEIKDILKRQSLRDWFMFVAGINTGLRISDLLQFQNRTPL